MYRKDGVKSFLEIFEVFHGMLIATVHIESVQRLDKFVDDAYFMFPVGFIDAFPAEESIEEAGALETDVLYLLVAMGLPVNAVAILILVHSAHCYQSNIET